MSDATKRSKETTPAERVLILSDDVRDQLPSNQKKSSVDSKRASVVKNKPSVAKKPGWKKFIQVFVGDDPHSLVEYITYDVLVPAIKNTVQEAVTSGIEILLFGENKRNRRNIRRDRDRSYIRYGGLFDDDDERTPRFRNQNSRSRHEFDDLVFQTRSEAEAVLGNMAEAIIDYGIVSVADFYELSGLDSNFTDHNYGWDDLRGSRVRRTRQGYILDLPRTISLKN